MDLLQWWGALDVLMTQDNCRSWQDMQSLSMIPTRTTEKTVSVTEVYIPDDVGSSAFSVIT